MKNLLISAGCLLFLSVPDFTPLLAQPELTFTRSEPPDLEMILSVRERFEYKVTYSFFTVGWIEVELMPDTTYNGKKARHLRTIIEANHRVPFVKRNLSHFQNLFFTDEKYAYSYVFWRDDLHDDQPEAQKIIFDREMNEVRFFEKGEPGDTLALEEPASGGDISFIISRMFAGIEEEYRLPVYLDGKMGYVSSISGPVTEMREYEAFDKPIETFKSEGTAEIDGPFGFTGDFKSWFATDDRRLPLEAHVRVLFGNVKIKLTNYEIIDE
ncbi:MAG: DUF3108 domain-containing protein [Balneolaceae bacterium]